MGCGPKAGPLDRPDKERSDETEIDKALELTPQEFARLGDGAVAYVKAMNSEDVSRLFPQAPPIQAIRRATVAAAPVATVLLTPRVTASALARREEFHHRRRAERRDREASGHSGDDGEAGGLGRRGGEHEAMPEDRHLG